MHRPVDGAVVLCLGKTLNMLKLVLIHPSVDHVLEREFLLKLGLLLVRVLLKSLREGPCQVGRSSWVKRRTPRFKSSGRCHSRLSVGSSGRMSGWSAVRFFSHSCAVPLSGSAILTQAQHGWADISCLLFLLSDGLHFLLTDKAVHLAVISPACSKQNWALVTALPKPLL